MTTEYKNCFKISEEVLSTAMEFYRKASSSVITDEIYISHTTMYNIINKTKSLIIGRCIKMLARFKKRYKPSNKEYIKMITMKKIPILGFMDYKINVIRLMDNPNPYAVIVYMYMSRCGLDTNIMVEVARCISLIIIEYHNYTIIGLPLLENRLYDIISMVLVMLMIKHICSPATCRWSSMNLVYKAIFPYFLDLLSESNCRKESLYAIHFNTYLANPEDGIYKKIFGIEDILIKPICCNILQRYRSLLNGNVMEDVHDDDRCSICDTLFYNPVSFECGHNICSHCEEKMNKYCSYGFYYDCPLCRGRIRSRPQVNKTYTSCLRRIYPNRYKCYEGGLYHIDELICQLNKKENK